MTNGGKSTLSQSLHQQIPNSCIIAQDSYFKVNCLNHVTAFRHTGHLRAEVLLLSYRKTVWYQWTATGLSNMTVRTKYFIIQSAVTKVKSKEKK